MWSCTARRRIGANAQGQDERTHQVGHNLSRCGVCCGPRLRQPSFSSTWTRSNDSRRKIAFSNINTYTYTHTHTARTRTCRPDSPTFIFVVTFRMSSLACSSKSRDFHENVMTAPKSHYTLERPEITVAVRQYDFYQQHVGLNFLRDLNPHGMTALDLGVEKSYINDMQARNRYAYSFNSLRVSADSSRSTSIVAQITAHHGVEHQDVQLTGGPGGGCDTPGELCCRRARALLRKQSERTH